MSLYVLKPKTENKNIIQDYMIGTGTKCKSSLKFKYILNTAKQKNEKVHTFEKDCSFENILILISKLLCRSPQKSMSLLSSVFVSRSRKPHQNVLLNNNKNSNLNTVFQNAQNRLLYTTLSSMSRLCIQTKNRKQKHIIYNTLPQCHFMY